MRQFVIQIFLFCVLRLGCVSTQDAEFPINDGNNKPRYGDYGDRESQNSSTKNIDLLYNKYQIDTANIFCDSSNLCELGNHQDYPAEYIEQLIESDPLNIQPFVYKIGDWGDTRSTEGCASDVRIKYPKIARDTSHHWHFIVNIGEFLQPVRVETCTTLMNKCANDNFLRKGVTSFCKQEYGSVPLRSLDVDGNIREYDYTFPTYCKCELRMRRKSTNKYQPKNW